MAGNSDGMWVRIYSIPDPGTEGGRVWIAHLIVDGRVIGQGAAHQTKTDPRSDGTAVTQALLNFQQRIGLDTRYDDPKDDPKNARFGDLVKIAREAVAEARQNMGERAGG